jgi:hypothetical protein
VWKKHYSDLFTPKTNPKYDDEFRRFVEAKITEYESESFNAENDPLYNAFTEHEVLDVCSKFCSPGSSCAQCRMWEQSLLLLPGLCQSL